MENENIADIYFYWETTETALNILPDQTLTNCIYVNSPLESFG